jgi:serine/threonine protein kinase
MSVPAELNDAGVADAEDALRALLSSMLSGRYSEELYLRRVSKLCREEPEAGPQLLGLIDRYHRLGRMPAEQFQKVKARIEQEMGIRPAANEGLGARLAEDDIEEESVTRELTPVRAKPAPPAAARMSAAPASIPAVPAARHVAAPGSPPAARPAAQPAAPPAPAPAAQAPSEEADVPQITIGIGTVLRDRYELLQLLGRGGMASVYKARDRYRTSLGVADCYVALKIVQPHPSRPGSVDALGREFHNAQRLSHPNVINVYDIDREADASFYSMEFLDGERLSQLVKRAGGRLPRPYALAIVRDIGDAIAHAHSRGVVHSDLKPHNIMITREGHVRVLDFGSGIVRSGEPWISELSPGGDYRQATPAYASCEQLQGWCADPRDDIYALACLTYQLLAGRHPFDQRSSLVARGRRMRARRPPGMRGDNWRALRRGLAWSREQRNMTMEKWLEQLGVADVGVTLPPLARLAATPAPRLWPQRAAAAAAVVLALGLGAFAIDRQAGIDWPQTLAGMQRGWDGAWRWLHPMTPTGAVAPTREPAKTQRLPPPPAPSPATNLPAPTAPPAQRAPRASRLAAVAAAPAGSGIDDADGLPAAESATVAFATASYDVAGGEPAARVVVRRVGSTDRDVSFTWWTEGASARPDVDYAPLGRRVETIPSGSDKITVFVPIISNPQRTRPSQFYVALGNGSSSAAEPPSARATVTIDPPQY